MPRKKASEDPNAPKCIINGCQNKSKWKGLCPTCYGGAKQLIEEELTTWVELQALGLAEGPPILKEFGRLKQLKLFGPDIDPKVTLQDVLDRADPERHKDVRSPKCSVSPTGEHKAYTDLRPDECIYCQQNIGESVERCETLGVG